MHRFIVVLVCGVIVACGQTQVRDDVQCQPVDRQEFVSTKQKKHAANCGAKVQTLYLRSKHNNLEICPEPFGYENSVSYTLPSGTPRSEGSLHCDKNQAQKEMDRLRRDFKSMKQYKEHKALRKVKLFRLNVVSD